MTTPIYFFIPLGNSNVIPSEVLAHISGFHLLNELIGSFGICLPYSREAKAKLLSVPGLILFPHVFNNVPLSDVNVLALSTLGVIKGHTMYDAAHKLASKIHPIFDPDYF